ncbi:unnamed protein product [Closterium sp. Yama58-4]|nr:unnamed protein product [Closterium sp. Yama58-4]
MAATSGLSTAVSVPAKLSHVASSSNGISGTETSVAFPSARQATRAGSNVGEGRGKCRCSTAEILHDGARDPLLLRVARGEDAERTPVWLMRQAGRYMKDFRKFSDKYPFRMRSETAEIAIELTLQPWKAFGTDGVIMFSDILTILPAIGVEFDMVKGKGPVIADPLRTKDDLRDLKPLEDPDAKLPFIREILTSLRRELAGSEATLLGFVGTPWTLAAYAIEGQGSKNLLATKRMMLHEPELLHGILAALEDALVVYVSHQISCGAHIVQLFDSWAHHLTPAQFAEFSLPYAERIVQRVKQLHPHTPLIFHANGGTGKLHLVQQGCSADVVGLDWGTDMAEARRVFGSDAVLQGNVDPMVLFGPEASIRAAVADCLSKAGGRRHILNVGHGVVQGTPEESVALFSMAAVASSSAVRVAAVFGAKNQKLNAKSFAGASLAVKAAPARLTMAAEAPAGFSPPELKSDTPSPIFGGSTGGLLRKAQVEEFYVITWEAKKEQIFEMPTGGAAIMRAGPNLLKLARKEQCLALGTQLRTKFKINYQFYRVFPSGEVQYLHPKDGVYPEKVNAGRANTNVNLRSIGKNVDPAVVNATLVGECEIWVVGGSDERAVKHDVFAFNTRTREWRQVQTRGRYAEYPRVTHAAMVHPQHATWLLIHGGYGGNGPTLEFLDDLCVLDTGILATMLCAEIFQVLFHLFHLTLPLAPYPMPNARQSSLHLPAPPIPRAYDPLSNAWEQPTVAPGSPQAQPRSNHAATGVGGGMAVVHGGRVKKERLDDLWLLQVRFFVLPCHAVQYHVSWYESAEDGTGK